MCNSFGPSIYTSVCLSLDSKVPLTQKKEMVTEKKQILNTFDKNVAMLVPQPPDL